jgi:hypothetical protein
MTAPARRFKLDTAVVRRPRVTELPIPVLIPEAYTALSIGALAVGLVALVIGVAATRRAGRLAAHYQALMQGADGADLAAVIERIVARLDAAEGQIGRLQSHTSGLEGYVQRTGTAETGIAGLGARIDDIDARLRRALRHLRLLRYNAYADVGGDQSFVLALVDDHGDGVVISGLHHRSGVRVYAKPLADLRSTHTLTAEEARVVADLAAAGPQG